MSTNLNNKMPKVRKSILIFLKASSAPLVVYPENIDTTYTDLKRKMETANPAIPKPVEMKVFGPIKIFTVLDTQIAALAIQEEIFQG